MFHYYLVFSLIIYFLFYNSTKFDNIKKIQKYYWNTVFKKRTILVKWYTGRGKSILVRAHRVFKISFFFNTTESLYLLTLKEKYNSIVNLGKWWRFFGCDWEIVYTKHVEVIQFKSRAFVLFLSIISAI